ncbi:MAG: translational GTPase TypA [candidate division Zixibacteria bacterium]|nr:translational GTPase TypA [candidate division Zixibacteria bacterium]
MNLRNIAIIAHVDHGKTTLVDAMLRQTHVQRNIDTLGERIMDSMDLERERGITIRAKNASIVYNNIKINIVDTPGHADFGGEVERILRMVDGALLLIDAKEGPMPQTRFVLRKAIELGLPCIVVVNKVDRPDSDVDRVVNATFDLFVELGASDEQLDFPIVYASAIYGTATLDPTVKHSDLTPLFDTIVERIPAPEVFPDEPFRMLTLALHYDPYKGQMGIGKVLSGSIGKGQSIVQLKAADGERIAGRCVGLLAFEGLERRDIERVPAGEIVAVAGLPDIKIGDTIADPAVIEPLPPVKIDEPTVRMTFAVNTSPFSGREGDHVTSQRIKERLWKEMEVNVALRVEETDARDTFLVSGRGELHLAILIETMRREGYELQVSQPEVILRTVDGVVSEPYEWLTIDVPDDFQGAVMEALGERGAALQVMSPVGAGEIHLEYRIPTRGVIGLKTRMMTATRGHAIMYHIFDDYHPVEGPVQSGTPHGSLIAAVSGTSTSYALDGAQERGALFISPGIDVYTGMIVGQHARDKDLEVNVCRSKHLTNMRAAGADDAILLTTPREITLEYALEYIGSDELVEVTPKSIRLRKRLLDANDRKRTR